jgi:hypothetical protein
MLLGVTTLGGDEPLGGWSVPERTETLFETTYFTLNTVIAAPFCSVDLSGDILGLNNPFGTDQFEYGQAFSDIITGEAQCIGLDDSLSLDCFTAEIAAPPPSVGLRVPRNVRLNAEFDTYGLSGSVISFNPATVTLMQNDVIYYDSSLTNPDARVSTMQTDVIYLDDSLDTISARMTQVVVDVITPAPEANRGQFIVYGQDATLTYSGA